MKRGLQFILLVLVTPALAYAPGPKSVLSAFTNINDGGASVTNTLSLNLPQTVRLLFDGNGNLTTNDGVRSFLVTV